MAMAAGFGLSRQHRHATDAAPAIKIFLTGPPTAQSNGSAALIL